MGIHNGLVTILWSLALLIALAAAVRVLLFRIYFQLYVLTALYSNAERKLYSGISPLRDLIDRIYKSLYVLLPAGVSVFDSALLTDRDLNDRLYPFRKVYLVTMLASLNSRPIVRPDLDPVIQSVLQRSASPRPSARHSLDSFVRSPPRLACRISTYSSNFFLIVARGIPANMGRNLGHGGSTTLVECR